MSDIEYLLNAYKNGEDISNFKCNSRIEHILKKKCLCESCDDITPQSDIEYLLINLPVGASGEDVEAILNGILNDKY